MAIPFRLAALAAVLLPTIISATPVSLINGDIQAQVDPATLSVDLKSTGGTTYVSRAQSLKSSVSLTAVTTTSLSWTDPARRINYRASLDAEGFHFVVQTSSPQSITWPIIDAPDEKSAFVMPLGMGAYVPVNDMDWQSHLIHQSPMRMTEGFSMPFAGLLNEAHAATWLFKNQFHNDITFTTGPLQTLSMAATHQFTTASLGSAYQVSVSLEAPNPTAPALAFRRWIMNENEWLPLSEKADKIPNIERLAGAAHIYVWGEETLNLQDVSDWKGLSAALKQASQNKILPGSIFFEKATPEEKDALSALATEEWPGVYAKQAFITEANRLIRDWGDTLATTATEPERLRVGSEKLTEMFPKTLKPPADWGGGLSIKIMDQLKSAGIDRLWIGLDTWRTGLGHPEAVQQAEKNGYLIGPYDSYHSMHSPTESETWETAQFGEELYATGAIIDPDGKSKPGFKQKGRLLSPAAARPYVEKRIGSLMKQVPFNSWFFDCDAFGQYYDSYSDKYPQTEQSDLASRLERMQWAAQSYGLVIGSEGGISCATQAIAFAHGMMTPGIAWGDEQMYRDKSSPYYLGRYWPPNAPEVFFKQVMLKEELVKFHFDPVFRLPLYSIALGDSVVPTHQWGFPSRKFSNHWQTVRLTELLYGVPPLDHVIGQTLTKWLKDFLPYYKVFSPFHREIFYEGMTSFEWLSPDRTVQKSTFGDKATVTVNFGNNAWEDIAPMSAVIDYHKGAELVNYKP